MEMILKLTHSRLGQLFYWHLERLMTRRGLILWGKDAGDAPTPPSPQETTDAQINANKRQAQLDTNYNRWLESTPFGSVGWERGFDQQQYDADVAKRQAEIDAIAKQQEATWRKQYDSKSAKFKAKTSWEDFKNKKVSLIPEKNVGKISEEPNMAWERYNTFTRKTELNPELQNLLDNQIKGQNAAMNAGLTSMGRTNDVLKQPMLNFGARDLPEIMQAMQTPEVMKAMQTPEIMEKLQVPTADLASRQRVEDALMQRLNPYLDRDQAAMQNQLANQGLVPGSEAYTNAMNDINRQRNDARLAVIGQGGDEMARQFGMQMQGFQGALGQNQALYNQAANNFGLNLNQQNQIYNQGLQNFNANLAQQNQIYGQQSGNFGLGMAQDSQLFNQDLQRRNQSLGETQGLFGLSGNVPIPQSNSGQVSTNAGVDAAGALQNQFQGQMGAYNSKVAQNNATTQAAVGGGAALAGIAIAL